MDSLKNNIHLPLPEMVFLIGMGRSGTTLLTNILNLHDEVVATPENEFIINFHNTFRDKDFKKNKVIEEFVDLLQYKHSKTVSFWKPDKGLLNSIMELEASQKTYENVCKLVYLHYPFAEHKQKVKLIIDKNPVYSIYIKDLKKLYPSAKFIVLVRDYRDNIISRKRYSDPKSSIYKLAASWNYFYDVIKKDSMGISNDIIYIKYENLVEQPEKELKTLCSFLGICYHKKLLSFQDLSKKIKSHFKNQVPQKVFDKITNMHENLEKEINTNRVNAFKNEMEIKDLQLLDQICKTNAKLFNYKSSDNSNLDLSFLEKVNYFISYFYVKLYYKSRPFINRFPLKFKLIKE